MRRFLAERAYTRFEAFGFLALGMMFFMLPFLIWTVCLGAVMAMSYFLEIE